METRDQDKQRREEKLSTLLFDTAKLAVLRIKQSLEDEQSAHNPLWHRLLWFVMAMGGVIAILRWVP